MRRIFYCLLFSVLLMGCTNAENVQIAQQKANEQIDEKELQEALKAFPIQSANILFYENEIIIAVQLHPYAKMKKKKHEKAIEKSLAKQFDTKQIFVSSDYKMYIEVAKLMKDPTAARIEALKSLAKEQT